MKKQGTQNRQDEVEGHLNQNEQVAEEALAQEEGDHAGKGEED